MLKKKALILYPKIPETYWSFIHAVAIEGKDSAFPPLGALTIASLFPKDRWDVELIDQNVAHLRDRDLRSADYVFISAMTVQRDSVIEDIKRTKQFNKPTILGGPIVSTHQAETRLADCRVEGEAETLFPQLLEDLVNSELKTDYKASERPSMLLVPQPSLGLINLKRYSTMSVQFSRGCPYNCDFCDITKIYGRVPRVKSIGAFLNELDDLYHRGWRKSVFVVDDNFIGNLPAVRCLLPELERWQSEHDYPFSLFTESSVNLADHEDVLDGMHRAGYRKVFLGIETPVKESLRETRKTQNLRSELSDSVRKIQGNGIEVMAGFIMGFDNDPRNIAELQEKFITEEAIPLAMVGLLTAIPGTGLYKRLEKEGRILEDTSGNNTDGLLNFLPKMDKGHLVSSYKTLMNRLYSSKNFYERALNCLDRIKGTINRGYNHITFNDMCSFAKSIIMQGMIDKDRGEYWSYISNLARNYRERFSEGVTLAVMGRHFRKVTETYF